MRYFVYINLQAQIDVYKISSDYAKTLISMKKCMYNRKLNFYYYLYLHLLQLYMKVINLTRLIYDRCEKKHNVNI